jgi:hypothetical protein
VHFELQFIHNSNRNNRYSNNNYLFIIQIKIYLKKIIIIDNKEAWKFSTFIKMELKNILPVINQYHSIEEIFDILSSSSDFTYSNSLLEISINILLSPDYAIIPRNELVTKIKSYILKKQNFKNTCLQLNNNNNNNINNDKNLILSSINDENFLSKIDNTDDFRLMLTVIGGLSTNEIIENLLRIVQTFLNTSTNNTKKNVDNSVNLNELKIVFEKITKARPPPLSKLNLLIALHKFFFFFFNINYICTFFFLIIILKCNRYN